MEEHTSKIIDGKYRFILSCVLFLQMSNCNVIGNMFPYFFMDPIVECDDAFRNKETGVCDIDEMCNSKAPFILSGDTLSNWSSYFNLYCPRSSYKLIITTLYFIASAVAPIIISNLPDRYGRMRVFNWLVCLMFVAFVMLLFKIKLFQIIAMTICGGLIIIYNVEVQIITEYYDANVRGFLTGIFCAAIPCVGSISIVLFYYFHTIQSFWWILVITQGISIVLINMYFVESPLWLASIGKFDEAMTELKKAAEINNKMPEYDSFMKISDQYRITQTQFSQEKNTEKCYTFKDTWHFVSVRKIILAIAPYWMAVLLFDFTVFLNLEKSNRNIYLQGIVVFVSCTVAALIAGYLADLLGRKKMLIISVIFSVVPYIFTPYFSAHGYVYSETFCLFIACISIETAFTVIIIYVGEIFPTTIRSTASGMLYLGSRVGAIAAPYAVFFFDYPQYFVSILLVISVYFIWHLPETKGRALSTDVEENLTEKLVANSNELYSKGKLIEMEKL